MGAEPFVLIVAPAEDDHASCMLEVLRRRAVRAECLDLSATNKDMRFAISMGGERREYTGEEPHNTTVWWRRPRPPSVDERVSDDRCRRFVRQQWQMAIESRFSLCGFRFVNRPDAERRANLKPVQLQAAKSAGLSVPRTLITNQADLAERFICDLRGMGSRCVFKPLAPGRYHFGETRIIDGLAGYEGELGVAPVIFQECIERGRDVRVTLFGSNEYATYINTPSDMGLIDWRIDPLVEYEPCTLSDVLLRKLRHVLSALGLATGTFDLRFNRCGEPYFFEVNPSGQFLYLIDHGFPEIASRFADFLIMSPQSAG